jgi:hypothetical protein
MHAQLHTSELAPEQQARIQSKKMALRLGLSEEQRSRVESIQLKEILFHQEMKAQRNANKEKTHKPSKQERADAMELNLDRHIAIQNQMREILSEEQFQNWKKHQKHKHTKMKKKKEERKKEHS